MFAIKRHSKSPILAAAEWVVPVAALNFMNGGSIPAGLTGTGSAHSQELGSAFGRASVQEEVPDSTYTNGHRQLSSQGSQGLPEGRPISFQAPLQGSQAPFGTRERGDRARGPERQGSYNRLVLH